MLTPSITPDDLGSTVDNGLAIRMALEMLAGPDGRPSMAGLSCADGWKGIGRRELLCLC